MKDQFFPNQLVPVYDEVVRMGVSRKLHYVGILSQYCMLHLVQENQKSIICGHFQIQQHELNDLRVNCLVFIYLRRYVRVLSRKYSIVKIICDLLTPYITSQI